jgi:hypothetical protein
MSRGAPIKYDRSKGDGRKGPQVNPTTDSTLSDPQRIIAELQRANAELQHELDERDERLKLFTRAVAEGIYHRDIERNELRPSARLIEIFGFQGRDLTASD